jgi:hypothetical protein
LILNLECSPFGGHSLKNKNIMAKIVRLKISNDENLRKKALADALKMQDFLNKQIKKNNESRNLS